MKMLMSIVDASSAGKIADALIERRYGVTRIDTVGGFLRRGNATLLVGVPDEQVDEAIAIMRSAYGGRGEPNSGPVFVLKVDETARM